MQTRRPLRTGAEAGDPVVDDEIAERAAQDAADEAERAATAGRARFHRR